MDQDKKLGKYYWCIQTNDDKSIMLMADQIEVTASGVLVASYVNSKGDKINSFAMPTREWKFFYAASMIDGAPIVVDSWQ